MNFRSLKRGENFMLGYARIATIVMICLVYANHVSRETENLQIFVGIALFIYIVNHILLVKAKGVGNLFFIPCSQTVLSQRY